MTEAQPIQGTAKVKPRRGLIQNAKFTINGFSSRVRFQRCHSEEQSDEESVFVSFSRFPPFRLAGRSLGRRRPANIRLSPGVPRRLRPNPRQTYFVILNEVKNLFPCEPKAADGLCRARRRTTNEVQSRICLRILLYRFFVDLPISSE